MHEAALKAQAKKMNVESLRSGDQSGEAAEIKIAKVGTREQERVPYSHALQNSSPDGNLSWGLRIVGKLWLIRTGSWPPCLYAVLRFIVSLLNTRYLARVVYIFFNDGK